MCFYPKQQSRFCSSAFFREKANKVLSETWKKEYAWGFVLNKTMPLETKKMYITWSKEIISFQAVRQFIKDMFAHMEASC